ncbi:MAG TPA: hypothetical protein VII12_03955 [Thermoanaerobaculia bacterium]
MKRNWLLGIAGMIVLALLTWSRIRLIDSLPDQGYFAKYTIVADQILAGHIPRDRLLDFSPLYLWFIVAMRAIGAGFHAIRTLQIVFLSVAAVLVAIASRRFGPVATIVAPILLLGSRGALVCATELEPETLILLFNAASLAALERNQLLAGIFLGLSATCRPVALLVVVALAIAMRSWRLIAGALAPVAIILIVNLSLTGEMTLMDPGTVFYEGMNPNAAGYEGVQPRIVNDLERQSRDPDYLHVAYRVVAARALGHPVTRAESNRYWTTKALAFARAYPLAALRLTARKFYFALHSYDAYDLSTMARKNFLLAQRLFIPFGVIVALALIAVILRVKGIAPLVIFTGAAGFTLVVFYVTARQRNALLPSLVILAAAGLAEIVARRHITAAVIAAVIAVLLSINGPAQREDAAGWLDERNQFDEAIALEQQGRWAEADALLARLEQEGYRPIRENRAVSSIAYYRAVAAAHLGQTRAAVLNLLERANAENPGNEHILAALGDPLLDQLHDPFTARQALFAARQQGM